MSKDMDLSATVKSIASTEKSLARRLDDLKQSHPQVFAELDEIERAHKEVESLKATVKTYLDEQKDYDVHDEGDVRVSISRIVRIGVEDIDKVPDEYKETQTLVVANEKKAEEHLRLYGTLPEGFVDKSYSRFNWKVKGGF